MSLWQKPRFKYPRKKKKKRPDLAPGPDLSLHGQFLKRKLKKMASFASRARFGKNLPRSKNDVISQFAIGLLWQKPRVVFGRFRFLP
jgi:hypothetical protein